MCEVSTSCYLEAELGQLAPTYECTCLIGAVRMHSRIRELRAIVSLSGAQWDRVGGEKKLEHQGGAAPAELVLLPGQPGMPSSLGPLPPIDLPRRVMLALSPAYHAVSLATRRPNSATAQR